MMRAWTLAAGFGWRPVVRHLSGLTDVPSPQATTQSGWTTERDGRRPQREAEREQTKEKEQKEKEQDEEENAARLPRAARMRGKLPQQHAQRAAIPDATEEQRERSADAASEADQTPRSGGAHAVADQRSAALTG